MQDLLRQVESQLLGAIREQLASRRARRRRRVMALAAAGVLLLAVSGASAISGTGPIADVLGVDKDDPTLRSVKEVPGSPRAVVRVRGDDGHLYTFVGFHARRAFVSGSGRSLCSTQTRDDARRIPGLGCIAPVRLAKMLRRHGLLGGSYWGSTHEGGLRVTGTVSGFVPGDARSVTLQREGHPAVKAELSDPIPVSLRAATRPARTRAFLAVESHDADGATWLEAPVRNTVSVVLADGTTRRQTDVEPQFMPMAPAVRPGTSSPVHMGHAGYPDPWRSVSYSGKRGTLCTAAAPVGERLITLTKLQCSSPLAVVNALTRYGAAGYISNFNPSRERGRRSVAVFGFTRADARSIALVDRRGRRYEARLTRPWGRAVRRDGDLAGLDGDLRRRLERLPKRMAVRSWITSLDVPPEPSDCGLRLEVKLSDGHVLRAGPAAWRCRSW
jgi:hypothetical protein